MLHEIIDVLVDDLLHTSRKIIANLDEIEDEVATVVYAKYGRFGKLYFEDYFIDDGK